MKINITSNAICGKVRIPPGEYMVSLNSDVGEILLTGRGKDLKLPATRRRASAKQTRVTTVSFYCGGGPIWSLVINTPKYGEWISLVEYVVGEREFE